MARTIDITPPGRLPLPDLRELWEAREIFWRFGMRDLLLRYKQTALGVIWVVIQPLLSAGVFSIVFGQIADIDSGPVPYFIFSFSGMLAWNLFNGVVTRASGSLVSNQALISKVFFPRILVPLSSVLSVMVDFLVAGALLVVLLLVAGIGPGLAVLTLPVWVLLLILLATGVGLLSAALMVHYRDVQYVVPFALQTLLYASPIATRCRRRRRTCAGCSRSTRSPGCSRASGGRRSARTSRRPGRWRRPWASPSWCSSAGRWSSRRWSAAWRT